jgi:hypothetical protein
MDEATRHAREGDLQNFAVRELEYIQLELISRRNIDGEIGRCLPLVALWLAEKRDTSNGRVAGIKRLISGEDRRLVGSQYDIEKNMNIYTSLDSMTEQYFADRNNIENLFLRAGFTVLSAEKPEISRKDVPEAIYEGIQGLGIRQLMAVIFPSRGAQAFHALGFYRSRGGNLHVFDANFGAYKLYDVLGFLKAWLDNYTALGFRWYLDARFPAFYRLT